MLKKVGKLNGKTVYNHQGELVWETDQLYLVKLTEEEREKFMDQDLEVALDK